MTTEHDSDPDATVRMPRPIPKKEDDAAALENADPDSTLIRDNWGTTTILPPPSVPPLESEPASVPQQQWDRTVRRPAHAPKL
jgi:hypothetical protein